MQYVYLVVDKYGDIIDFYLSPVRDRNAALTFFSKASDNAGLLHRVVIDKRGSGFDIDQCYFGFIGVCPVSD